MGCDGQAQRRGEKCAFSSGFRDLTTSRTLLRPAWNGQSHPQPETTVAETTDSTYQRTGSNRITLLIGIGTPLLIMLVAAWQWSRAQRMLQPDPAFGMRHGAGDGFFNAVLPLLPPASALLGLAALLLFGWAVLALRQASRRGWSPATTCCRRSTGHAAGCRCSCWCRPPCCSPA